MTSDQVEGALDLLTEDATELVSMATNHTNQSTYCVNMMRIMEVMQLKELEGGIRDKFGAEAMRVFSLLVYQKQLEQKQIADMAMMPLKDTREILYRLLKEEYIVLQEISKAVDHAPSRTFYLWHAKVISVSTKFLANVMEAALWALSRFNQNVTAPRAGGAGGPGLRPGGAPAQQGERRAQHSRSPSTRASWSTSLARIST